MTSYLQNRVGKRIKRLREESAMTQEALARKLRVSQATISEWEAGAYWVRPEKIERMAKIFGVHPESFLTSTQKGVAK